MQRTTRVVIGGAVLAMLAVGCGGAKEPVTNTPPTSPAPAVVPVETGASATTTSPATIPETEIPSVGEVLRG